MRMICIYCGWKSVTPQSAWIHSAFQCPERIENVVRGTLGGESCT